MDAGAQSTKRKEGSSKDEVPRKVVIKAKSGDSKAPAVISPIKIEINPHIQTKNVEVPKKTDEKLREIFNSEDESEEEEIPEEAKIRMRNKGRYTPTSSGPNSYGKGRFGFIDRRAVLNRQTELLNEIVSEDNR
ncbi:unnamed protein product [Calicophoron daubneyi]|uniref:PEST proteolytic signal-containing nuclear protein n=1 Tax=Calicophoron daubneyi TaxID=300641 RepID=A0AAV2TBC8_CALDB